MQPRMDAPLPLWMIFPVIFAALYASHFTLLRLPYYWDEAGYYIPAAWDFFRTGSLIPITTLTNAHPPLPSIYLALWWKMSGFYPEVTREAVLMVASLGLLAVWRLAHAVDGLGDGGLLDGALTGLYPIWFAQSTLAHADIFAAACTLWGLVYALPAATGRKPWAAALWFMAAALSKETAIAIPLTLAVLDLVDGFRVHAPVRRRMGGEAMWLAAVFCRCAGWYAWHYSKTGFLFGNPEYLRYNAQATTGATADSGCLWASHPAPDRAHEPVCAVADDVCGTAAEAAAGCGRTRAGGDQRRRAAADSSSAAGQCAALQRAGRRAADALPAAHVSAGAAGGGVNVLPAGALLAGAGGVFGSGICGGVVYQSAVSICAGRQPGVCARDSDALAGIAQLNKQLSRRDGALGVARDR